MSFRTKFKFRTKNLGIFWCIVAVIWKSVCYTWYQQSWICRDARFGAKTKEKKKRKRKRKSWNLGWKMTCLGIFKLKFEKTIAISDINTLKFVQMRKFVDNKKKIKFRRKNAVYGYYSAVILKSYLWYLKSAMWNLCKRKVSCKNKCGAKNVPHWYF